MTPNWYKIFYWLTVADNAKAFFTAFIIISMIGSTIFLIMYIGGRDEADWDKITSRGKAGRVGFFYMFPFMILFWALYIFTPSKSDTLLIIAGVL